MGADGRRWHGTKFGRKKSRPLHPLLSQFSESVVRLFGPLDTSAQQEPSCGTLANQANLDWTKLGRALRASADDAHDGKTPDVTIAYSFLLENPECFILDENGEDQEWPADMPQEPPIELIAAYYEVETALDLCC